MWLLPERHRPFGDLDLEDKIGAFTQLRIMALHGDAAACAETIAQSQLVVSAVPDREEGGFCALENAVSIERSVHPYSQAVTISCPLAAALYVWEREVLAPAAQRYLQQRVTRIEVAGSYACRRIYGQRTGRISEHARANAIDITGFTLDDGRVLSVERGWNGRANERAFLRAVRDGACRVFNGVLSPDYNRAHRDHFHLDAGRYDLCE